MSTIRELESQLEAKRREAYEIKRRAELQKQDEFRHKENLDVYTSDDYCGLAGSRYSFYYGYEETWCPVKSHRQNCEDNGCDKREWCFVVWENKGKKKEVMRIPKSQLWPVENEEPFFYLVSGIGKFLNKEQI